MIPAAAHLEVAWLDPADVVPDPPQQLVNAPDERGRYSIRDGRHRWASHLALGRDRIRCVVVSER